ncbi:MAG: tetratricopeptide repeat protein [Pirellulales bacterium]
MNEEPFLKRLWEVVHESPATTAEALKLSDAALQACPWSAELWYLRGLILDKCEELPNITREDYRHCYERAIECDPGFVEAHVALGYTLDVYYDDFPAAESAFRKAIALGGGEEAYVGLARVLAQQGRSRSALRLLHRLQSRKHSTPVQLMIREIEEGQWG